MSKTTKNIYVPAKTITVTVFLCDICNKEIETTQTSYCEYIPDNDVHYECVVAALKNVISKEAQNA